MIKSLTLLSRDTETSLEELAEVASSGRATGAPSELAFNPAVALRPDKPAPPGGALVAYFEDIRDALGWKAAVDAAAGRDPGHIATVVATEHVIRGNEYLYEDGHRRIFGGVKAVAFLAPRKGMTAAEFGDYWLTTHAALADDVIPAHIRSNGYVQNHAVDEEQPYAGVAESHWKDVQALRVWSGWYGGESGEPLRVDEANFLDPEARIIVITSERLVSVK